MKNGEALYTWTIYKGVKNFPPEMYVARKWKITAGVVTLMDQEPPLISFNLETIRGAMQRLGFSKMIRMKGDDPTIIESWL